MYGKTTTLSFLVLAPREAIVPEARQRGLSVIEARQTARK
jgi:hypothetical protein